MKTASTFSTAPKVTHTGLTKGKAPAKRQISVQARSVESPYVSVEESQALISRGFAARQERLSSADMMNTEAAAALANTTRTTINAWIKKGRCIGLKQAKRGFLIPAWQFEPQIWDFIPLLAKALGTTDGWTMLNFLESPLGSLDGMTPKEAMKQGKGERVINLAAHESLWRPFMRLSDLPIIDSYQLTHAVELYGIQRKRARPGGVTIGSLQLPPSSLLNGRFDVASWSIGYFSQQPETAIYEALARREETALTLVELQDRALMKGRLNRDLNLLDLREHTSEFPVLQSLRYSETQALAAEAASSGFDGIVYLSAQQHNGCCFAIFGSALRAFKMSVKHDLINGSSGAMLKPLYNALKGSLIPITWHQPSLATTARPFCGAWDLERSMNAPTRHTDWARGSDQDNHTLGDQCTDVYSFIDWRWHHSAALGATIR